MQTRAIPLLLSLTCTAALAQNTSFVIEGRAVKGIPYSARAVTSTKQTLVTGSEISTTVSALVARDSEGRTHREQTLLGIGGLAIGRSESPTVIVIQDPVKMVNYTLDP